MPDRAPSLRKRLLVLVLGALGVLLSAIVTLIASFLVAQGMGDTLAVRATLSVVAKVAGGTKRFEVRSRIDTPEELNYYRHGGILHYVLRQLAARTA